jgi:hypothetical protein
MAFEANLSRIRVALMLAGSIAFVLAGLWLVGAFGTPPSTSLKAAVAGWAGIGFFGLCSVVLARRLFQAGVEIRIDANGIYWRRWSDQTIPWNAIARISTGEIRRQRFVCLFLIDPRAFPSQGIAGKLAGANAAMGFGDIALTATGTDTSFDDLMAAIERFAPV